jgi:hypothetical protein
MHAADRLVTVTLRLHAFVEVVKILLERFSVCAVRHLIDSYRSPLAQALIRAAQQVHIDEVGQ